MWSLCALSLRVARTHNQAPGAVPQLHETRAHACAQNMRAHAAAARPSFHQDTPASQSSMTMTAWRKLSTTSTCESSGCSLTQRPHSVPAPGRASTCSGIPLREEMTCTRFCSATNRRVPAASRATPRGSTNSPARVPRGSCPGAASEPAAAPKTRRHVPSAPLITCTRWLAVSATYTSPPRAATPVGRLNCPRVAPEPP
mmetsp:Transcript_10236/g.20660  ORF Transcript_10236/g.20660 Transcript_10236/m.20660 type:complete len:200 (+) Transcript_10236:20-619(+)